MVPSSEATQLLSDCHRTHLQNAKTLNSKFQTKQALGFCLKIWPRTKIEEQPQLHLRLLSNEQDRSGAPEARLLVVSTQAARKGCPKIWHLPNQTCFSRFRPRLNKESYLGLDPSPISPKLLLSIDRGEDGEGWPVWQVPEQGCCSSPEPSRNLPLFCNSRLWTKITSYPTLTQIFVPSFVLQHKICLTAIYIHC